MTEPEGPHEPRHDPPDVQVRYHPLPPETGGGVAVRLPDGTAWVIVDDRAPPPEQRAVLHHELEHLRRGSVRRPGVPVAVIEREEAAIRRTVTGTLVPSTDLAALVRGAQAAGDAVTTSDVAAHFDVPVDVAVEACRLLVSGWPPRGPDLR